MAATAATSWQTSPGWFPFSRVLRKRFGGEVQKLTIDAGFTCPNRDGSKAWGGCSYCANASFSPAHRLGVRPIAVQLQQALQYYRRKRPEVRGLAYFQAFSNTYAPLPFLRQIYSEALEVEGVVGMALGTRPDCLAEPVLDLLARVAEKVPLWVEVGLESAEDAVLEGINRQCSVADFETAAAGLVARGIPVVAHCILGLPGESPQHDGRLLEILHRSQVSAVKLQHLYIAPRTVLARELRAGRLEPVCFEDHLERVIYILERLSPTIAIQRLVGELDPKHTLAPRWGLRKGQVLARVERELKQRKTWQGRLFQALALSGEARS